MIELYDFQKEGVEFLMKHHYALLADEMGLGKTIQALEVVRQTDSTVCIICPAFLKGNWAVECEKMGVKNPSIFSYSSLHKVTNLAEVVILDEAHYLKNPKAKRSLRVQTLVRKFRPERLIALSGTPIKNYLPDFFNLLSLISLNPKGTSGINVNKHFVYYSFCYTFCNQRTKSANGHNFTEFYGSKNVDKLKELLADKMLRRRAEECLSLPPIVNIESRISNPINEKELKGEFAAFKRGLALASAKMRSAIHKVKHTIDLVASICEEDRKCIVFTDHITPVDDIASGLMSKGIKTARVKGSTDLASRNLAVRQFQEGDLQVIVATIKALGTGVTLTAAQDMVFNDYPWIPSELSQATKRIHRIGQDEHCRIHWVIGGPIDKMILNSVQSKAKVHKEVLDE